MKLLRVAVFVAANAIIFFGSFDLGWLRLAAVLALTFVLPGWVWLPVLQWFHTPRAIERLVLIPGLSSLLTATALFLTLMLPGPFTELPVILALNALIVAGLIAGYYINVEPQPLEWPRTTTLAILGLIIVIAGMTRLPLLGYAEFHEDGLENMRLIVRAYKGEEYAPYLDSKGPIHWIMPASLWYLNGWLDEGIARTPFAVVAMTLVPLIYAIGRRMTGRESVGLAAAGFVAVNGFYVAYARHVENQALIVFWGALAMWWAYRYFTEHRYSFLPWMGLALAIGLVAHPDVLLYLPTFGFLILWKLWSSQTGESDASLPRSYWRHWGNLLIGGSLFAGLTALFYVPYLSDENIALVVQYFADDRIGQEVLYNRVYNLLDQDLLYSSRFHAPVLILLVAWLLTRNFQHWHRFALMAFGGLCVAIVSTVAFRELWIVGLYNLAFVPYALVTVLILVMPLKPAPGYESHTGTNFELKILYLWWSAALGALVFLAQDAADHIQVAYTAWALLAGWALIDLWHRLMSLRWAWAVQTGLIVYLAGVGGVILYYQHLTFGSLVVEYWDAKIDSETNPNSVYNWVYGHIPRPRKLFGNPRLSGWKVVGYLRESGQLSGDFRSINDSFNVPIWYTFQTPRSCYEDPHNYWVRRGWQGWPDDEQQVIEQGYILTRVVQVDGIPRLRLYEKNAPPTDSPAIFNVEDYRHRFDLLATPTRYAQDEQHGEAASFNFGDKLLMDGYHVPKDTVAPGDTLPVTVYWEALSPMEIRYRGFVHLLNNAGARVAQHDDDPACRLLTTDMRPGQPSSREFRLNLPADLPAGDYTVLFGIYHPDTFERLPIWDNLTQQSPGDTVSLSHITVE